MEVPTIFPDDASKMCPNIWTHFGYHLDTFWTFCWRISFFWKVSKKCPKYHPGLDIFWTQPTNLDTFWTSLGHLLDMIWTHFRYGHVLDTFWTNFGHILDTFLFFVSKMCPYLHCSGVPAMLLFAPFEWMQRKRNCTDSYCVSQNLFFPWSCRISASPVIASESYLGAEKWHSGLLAIHFLGTNIQ